MFSVGYFWYRYGCKGEPGRNFLFRFGKPVGLGGGFCRGGRICRRRRLTGLRLDGGALAGTGWCGGDILLLGQGLFFELGKKKEKNELKG